MNFHPFRNNILDYLYREFATPDNEVLIVGQSMTEFVVTVDGKEIMRSDDNSLVSARLSEMNLRLCPHS